MKTHLLSVLFLFAGLQFHGFTQNIPDVNLLFDYTLENCPSNPTISTEFSLSSADNTTWDVGFIMLTLTNNAAVLGTPQIMNAPAGWNTDVYFDLGQWQVELVDPNGGDISVGTASVAFFSLEWPYLQEGATFSINIDDADLGVNNSFEDEQLHYPNGLFISGSDDCASQTGEIDFYWFNPVIDNCPIDPVMRTPIQFASHNPGETWGNSFVQLVIRQDDAILGTPRIVNPLPGWTTDVYFQAPHWLIEMTSGVNHTITQTPTTYFELEWDYLQEGVAFSVVLDDIDLGLNVPNEIIHQVNGNTISGNAVCPCDVNIQNVSVNCTHACQALGTVFFDIDIHNGPGGPVDVTIGNQSRSIVVPAGDVIILDESFTNVSFLIQPHAITATFPGTTCGDALVLPHVNCGPCDIDIQSLSPTACDINSNIFDLFIDVHTQDLCNGMIQVSIDGGTPTSYSPVNNVVMINALAADGMNHIVEVMDDQIGSQCRDIMNYQAPASCQISASAEVEAKLEHIYLAPNPAPASTHVQVQSDYEIHALRLVDMAGKQVQEQANQGHLVTLETDDLLPGIYLVFLVTEVGSTTRKLMIQ